jgi:predicted transcriptional regulator
MPHAILSVRLDDALEGQLQAFAASQGLSRSAAARDLLRQVLTDAEPVTRGWLEGRQEAMSQVYSVINDALAGLSREA